MKNILMNQYKHIIQIVLNIVTVIMAFLLITTFYYMIQEFVENYNDKMDEDSFYYAMKDEDYYRMVDYYYWNMQSEKEPDETLTEYYGVAKYYEATFFLKAYEETGDVEGIQRMEADRERARSEMGDYAILAKKIDQKLGIE